MNDANSWHVSTRRKCSECGAIFIGPLTGRDYDNFCSPGCYHKSLKTQPISAEDQC